MSAKNKKKENMRRCFKCGRSPIEDENTTLFRFPKPGKTNTIRCELWAKYIFPGRESFSPEFQEKLYKKHRMLCNRHFAKTSFSDYPLSDTKLHRFAVPEDKEDPPAVPSHATNSLASQVKLDMPLQERSNILAVSTEEPQPGPSHITYPACQAKLHNMPLQEPSNILADSMTKPTPSYIEGKRTKKESELFLKCRKEMKKVCQLRTRLNKLKNKPRLQELNENNSIAMLSKKITPTFALLLQSQIINFNKKPKGRRWTIEEKILALRLYKRSPTCYRLMRRLFPLPAQSSLKYLLSNFSLEVGINKPIFSVLKKTVKEQGPDNEYVLLFDEMSIKKNLTYNKKKDIIEGFQDHALQGRCGQIASHALVFMLTGVRKRVKQPIAYYLSSSYVTADRLAILIKEIVCECLKTGISITATVCDMAEVNRRALTILGATVDKPIIKIDNVEVVSLFDTPHLLKCFRNLFLKYDIKCTTQITSTNTSGIGQISTEAAVTVDVIDRVDKLFDAVNSDSTDLRRGKIFSTNLKKSTPHIFEHFTKMKSFFRTLEFMGCSRKPPSQEGWIWSINAIELIWKKITNKYPNVKSLATRRIQQDPLENMFGCIRGNCGSNANPTAGQFTAALKTAVMTNLAHQGSGNCEFDNNEAIINNYKEMLINNDCTAQACNSEVEECKVSSDSDMFKNFGTDYLDEIESSTSELQACAYVCGYIIKIISTTCESCTDILANKGDLLKEHLFIKMKEYDFEKNSLNYASKNLINLIETCATEANKILSEIDYKKNIMKNIINNLRATVNYDFIKNCPAHWEANLNFIFKSISYIIIKRYCILKNRSFNEETSKLALRRKIEI